MPEREEATQIIESLAQRIIALHAETVVLFLLELHKPLAGILHTVTLLLSPIAQPLIGISRITEIKWLLESPQNIEALMQRIEQLITNERALQPLTHHR